MKINEEKIKNLIEKYKKTREKEILIEIIKEISIMIYNYPKIIFGRDEDACSDFYIYFVERIEKFILKYNSALASFNTYFNIVLKSVYLNWVNKLKYLSQKQPEVVLYNDWVDPKVEEKIFYDVYKQNVFQQDDLKEDFEKIFSKLDIKDYLILKLLYYPLDLKVLQTLTKFLKKKIKDCYNLYLQKYKKYNLNFKKEEVLQKIEKIKFNLEKIRKEMQTEPSEKLKFKKEKLEKSLNKLKDFYINLKVLDIKGVSEILGISLSEVYYRVKNIKKFLEQELKIFVR